MKPVTFLEALQFARSRKIVLPDEFYSLDLKTRQLTTTVSFLSSIEQIQSVIAAVNKAIADGSTFEDFKKLVAENEIKLSEPYLKNVFRTNIQTAYSHGRWQQQQRNRDKRPYLMYSAIDDSRVRPSHLALNRIIRHIDDPFWLMYYPPWGFMCRCTVVALTEKQAEKYGITPDDQLPEVAKEMGWSTSPMTYGDLSGLVDQKILDSDLDKAFLLEQKEVIKAEWTASKRLASLFAPMDDSTRNLFDVVANTVIPLDPSIRPSAIRTFLDYVQGNDGALTSYLNSPTGSLADDVLKRWLSTDMAAIQAVASNTSSTVVGPATLQQVAAYQVERTVQLDAPLLMVDMASDIAIKIENAKGLGIDLKKLNAGNGVLLPMGLSFEVVSIEMVEGRMIYTLKVLKN
ncbi:phage head morphogenesis protein [Acinetobacter radioresistens]|uniref:phage head morphogenesis protein n=1 Tax=Acinetobacter radioresistens TaxID=40216 RepID=UPI000E74BFBF|nr:phage minor head protein [Acinetobacter radioresistens]RJL71415.1 phage head morphogenesis protein [Acinetobacter radioresistens]